MFVQESFRARTASFAAALIDRHPLGTLVSTSPSGLFATHLPFLYERTADGGELLTTHIARANPHLEALATAGEVCVVFRGENHYVSPQWYASPVNAGTWNYLAAHLYGRPELVEDPVPLLALMERIVGKFESQYAAPRGIVLQPDRLERLLGRITGIRIAVSRSYAKAQLNQNRSREDQECVAKILSARPAPDARAIADEMLRNLREGAPDAAP